MITTTRFHTISVTGFEGPLDLLLELIEKETLDISLVSLAQVADQYLDCLKQSKNIPPSDLAEFLAVASRLILIKSRRLFPSLEISQEEEEEISNLEEQLREYQRYRIAARNIRIAWKLGPYSFSRESYLSSSPSFFPPNMCIRDIASSYVQCMNSLPSPALCRNETMRRIISLEERIAELQHRILESVTSSFRHDVAKGENKAEMVVSFLALLHLVKQQVVYVEQHGAFHDILIRRNQT